MFIYYTIWLCKDHELFQCAQRKTVCNSWSSQPQLVLVVTSIAVSATTLIVPTSSAITATVTSVTAAITAPVAPTEASAVAPIFARASNVDDKRAPLKIRPVHGLNSGLSFRLDRHLYKAEAPGASTKLISDNRHRFHSAKGVKGLLNIPFGCSKR
jgi:hypothetical protein